MGLVAVRSRNEIVIAPTLAVKKRGEGNDTFPSDQRRCVGADLVSTWQRGDSDRPRHRNLAKEAKASRRRRSDARHLDRARRAVLGCRLLSIRIARLTIVPTPLDISIAIIIAQVDIT